MFSFKQTPDSLSVTMTSAVDDEEPIFKWRPFLARSLSGDVFTPHVTPGRGNLCVTEATADAVAGRFGDWQGRSVLMTFVTSGTQVDELKTRQWFGKYCESAVPGELIRDQIP
jgi:hypothetical protein